MAEPAGFREYVAARYGALVRIAWFLTGDFGAAEDLVQAALMKTWPRWSAIARDDPDAYVRKVMLNTRSTWWRRSWRFEEPHAAVPDLPAPDELLAFERRQELVRLLAKLSSRQRAVVVLRYYEDLSEAQTADVLGCSVGAVKRHAARALAALRLSVAREPPGSSERDTSEWAEGR
jgi:RNA polymerase sigma-70 factor (sigma-E family)